MEADSVIERISPLKLGLAISSLLLAVLFLTETALNRWDVLLAGGDFDPLARVSGGVLRDIRIAIVHCLLLGYLPAALLHVLKNGRRTVLALQSALACTPDECEQLAASIRLSRKGVVITGLIGLTFAIVSPYLVPPVPEAVWSPSAWSPEVWWHRIPGLLIGLFGVWLGYAIVIASLRMSRIAEKLDRIDLLDLSPLAPFTQQGLTHAWLLVGVFSIESLMMLETGFGRLIIFLGVGTFLFCALAVWAPVRGVNKRVRQEKQSELRWLTIRISESRDDLLRTGTGTESGELADLVAYRRLVEDAPDWPFTGSTYVWLVIYAFIPAASWMIGFVVEQLVERTFF